MPAFITLSLAQSAARLSRLLGRGGGGALPGKVVDRLDSGLLGRLAKKLPHGVIIVTGTNGKTTTTKLIADMLTASGERVLSNRSGSNLRQGIISAFVAAADARGHVEATIGLFEVDEATLRRVAADLNPRHIVVLNLFRDQLDRYGELDTTAAIIGEGIAATNARVYLNADDPLVASLGRYAARPELVSYFGIEGLPAAAATAHRTVSDSDRCPFCGSRLVFSRVFYGHIGHYTCPTGDFKRPQPRVAVTAVGTTDEQGSAFTVAIGGKRQDVSIALPGTYNLYNGLAALAVADGLGIGPEVAIGALATTAAAYGRVEQIAIDGRRIYLLLIKNPAGFTQVLETFLLSQKKPYVLFAINDLAADGRDVSWLWDVPLEALTATHPQVITSGIRAADMTLRLKYADIAVTQTDDLEAALRAFIGGMAEGDTGVRFAYLHGDDCFA